MHTLRQLLSPPAYSCQSKQPSSHDNGQIMRRLPEDEPPLAGQGLLCCHETEEPGVQAVAEPRAG